MMTTAKATATPTPPTTATATATDQSTGIGNVARSIERPCAHAHMSCARTDIDR